MISLPPDLPPIHDPSPTELEECITYSATYFHINPNVIKAIVAVENGKVGSMVKNTNNTYDMGVMQINTIHLPDIHAKYPDLTWKEIAYNTCINVAIGTAILRDRINELRPGDNLWTAVGNYSSKTPRIRNEYLKKVLTAYHRIMYDKGRIE